MDANQPAKSPSRLPEPFYRGKVRDLYPVDAQSFVMVATDRISAFDVVFPEPIPGKGVVLTHISKLWFDAIRRSGLQQSLAFTDHVIALEGGTLPAPYNSDAELEGRALHVRKVQRVDFECVVRGYLAGSGHKDYMKTGAVCGHKLPAGLLMGSKLPQPIFTPATKAPLGSHDENVSVDAMVQALGPDLAQRLEKISIAIFNFASVRMQKAGILLCDTKFEFGLDDAQRIVLIDEVLTPDSSRYWDMASYKPGVSPPGYDKQYIRDYLESIGWNKTPPPPPLPRDVIERTQSLYGTISEKIRGCLV